jgi:hypothetical protein
VILESTPLYLYSETALRHLPDLPTTPKFLFVLREPAEQIHSVFNYFRNNWDWIPADLSFPDFMRQVDAGTAQFGGNEVAANAVRYATYVEHLAKWRDRVGADRMCVLQFEQLVRDPGAFMQRTAAFAGLDAGFFDDYAFGASNSTYTPRIGLLQKLNIAVRDRLPRGAVYRAARSVYRRINTTAPPPTPADDLKVLAELRERFEEPNRRLAAAFDIDLSLWQTNGPERGR